MKILLVAINAKYIHTSLAVRALAAYAGACGCREVFFREYTINQQTADILAELYRERADVICFSCYIWNITMVCELAENLKKILPDTRIICGGSEVSYDSVEFMKKNPAVDGVIRGEGELPFTRLCKNGFSLGEVPGVVWRRGAEIIQNDGEEWICDLDQLPFPYTEVDLEANRGKLIYYEASRGCPFRCSYCLSSTAHRLRFCSAEKVKRELQILIDHRIPVVKLTDRTFNADRERTADILQYLIDHAEDTTFHFEVAADLLDEKLLMLLENAPKDLFQLEIGVQSTNSETIREIDRITNFEKIAIVVTRLRRKNNMQLHLDLIAGLPHEDLDSFERSFNQVIALRPQVLQLGFLKLLKGTKIRREASKFAYRYTGAPPYEVLGCDTLNYEDILVLKGIENVFERYYNSGVFSRGLECLMAREKSVFGFFRRLSEFFAAQGYDKAEHSRNTLYRILCQFAKKEQAPEIFYDALKMDYLTGNKPATPDWSLIPYDQALHKKRVALITKWRDGLLGCYQGLSVNEILKRVHFEWFRYDVTADGRKKTYLMLFDIPERRLIGKVAEEDVE